MHCLQHPSQAGAHRHCCTWPPASTHLECIPRDTGAYAKENESREGRNGPEHLPTRRKWVGYLGREHTKNVFWNFTRPHPRKQNFGPCRKSGEIEVWLQNLRVIFSHETQEGNVGGIFVHEKGFLLTYAPRLGHSTSCGAQGELPNHRRGRRCRKVCDACRGIAAGAECKPLPEKKKKTDLGGAGSNKAREPDQGDSRCGAHIARAAATSQGYLACLQRPSEAALTFCHNALPPPSSRKPSTHGGSHTWPIHDPAARRRGRRPCTPGGGLGGRRCAGQAALHLALLGPTN